MLMLSAVGVIHPLGLDWFLSFVHEKRLESGWKRLAIFTHPLR